MLRGGSYEELAWWLRNLAASHAKRESPRVEVVLEAGEEREGRSYGIRLRAGDRLLPPPDRPALEFAYAEVADGRARFAWCEATAGRIRELARELLGAAPGPSSRSA